MISFDNGIKYEEEFDVTGMTCSACSNRVEKAVSHVPGVEDVNVNLLQKQYDRRLRRN